MKKTPFITIFLICGLLMPLAHAAAAEQAAAPSHKITAVKAIAWAKAGSRQLLLDVYTPLSDRKTYPVLLVFHGGGWLMNDRTIMDDMSAYVASHGKYVVVNADYRLLSDNDSAATIPQLIGDCLGALAWTKANIAKYGGDPARIAVTGDSAGGHLASMVALAGPRVGDKSFGEPDFIFTPTWLPPGKKAADLDWNVQALVSSYGVSDFYAVCKGRFEAPGGFWGSAKAHQVIAPEINVTKNPAWYKAVSPLQIIPKATERTLPPVYCQVGGSDPVVSPQSVKTFVAALNAKGQRAEYWEYPGKSHAYLDSGPQFDTLAPLALDRMITFLDGVLKP